MKLFIALALFALAGIASATPISCGNPKKGYTVTTDYSHKKATVMRNSQTVANGDLNCRIPESALTNGPVLYCVSPAKDTGYTVEFSEDMVTGEYRAVLRTQSFLGPQTVATLTCVHAHE